MTFHFRFAHRATFLALVAASHLVNASLSAQEPRNPTSSPLRTTLSAPSVNVPLTKSGDFFYADVKINGRPFRFTLETGGSFIGVSARAAQALGLRIESMEVMPGTRSRVAKIDSLTLGGATLHDMVVAVDSQFDRTEFDGIIGIPVLREFLWTMNLAGRTLTLEKGALPAPNNADVFAIPLEDRGRRVDFPITIDGSRFAAVMDTRYADWIMLPDSNATRIRMNGPLRTIGTARGPQTGTFEMRAGRTLDSARIGTFAIPQAPIVFRGRPGAIVGVGFLEQFIITVDLANQRVRFRRPAGNVLTVPQLAWERSAATSGAATPVAATPGRGPVGPTLQPGDRTIGFRIAALGSALSVTQLIAGSEADRLGIRDGDQIVEFDGTPAAQMNPIVFRAAIAKETAVRIVVERNGQRTTFEVKPYTYK